MIPIRKYILPLSFDELKNQMSKLIRSSSSIYTVNINYYCYRMKSEERLSNEETSVLFILPSIFLAIDNENIRLLQTFYLVEPFAKSFKSNIKDITKYCLKNYKINSLSFVLLCLNEVTKFNPDEYQNTNNNFLQVDMDEEDSNISGDQNSYDPTLDFLV